MTQLVNIVDEAGKIIGFVDPSRVSHSVQKHKHRFPVPILEPVSTKFDPNVDYGSSVDERATLEWCQVRFHHPRKEIQDSWFLVAIDLPEKAWMDDAFIQHVWQ